jgi:hypothetical protein
VMATWWRSLRSAAFTIGTNAARPEGAARGCEAPERRVVTARPPTTTNPRDPSTR